MNLKRVRPKSAFVFLASKISIVVILLLLQISFLLASVFLLADFFSAVGNIFTALSFLIVIWIVAKEENPSYKLAWVVLVLALPLFGGLLYLLFGNKSMPRKFIQNIAEMELRAGAMASGGGGDLALRKTYPRLASLSGYIVNTTGFLPWDSTSCEYFALGDQMWPAMLRELEEARDFIFMEYFIVDDGEMWRSIYAIMKRKAAQGLDVRLLYDDIGCIHTLPGHFARDLEKDGIRCLIFNPCKPHLNSMMNYRDHRKIMVIDGKAAFCGGVNIADEYINTFEKHGHWKDTGVLIKGRAVWNFTAMFLALWNFTKETDLCYSRFFPHYACPGDGFVQPFGDSPLDRINVCEDSYRQIITRAQRYVYIATPYLILDNEMVTALQTAARSGVDVRILTPKIPDKWFVHQCTQSFYQTLLDCGVRIFEYTKGFVHAKMYVSDDDVAVVGTANMDFRSFYLHFECGICFYGGKIIHDVKEDILKTLAQSSEVPWNYNRHVALWKRLMRSVLRLFAPLM